MIKTHPFTDNTQLTPHFNAHEFKCKCGQPHDFQLADELVSKLEELYEKLNCSKIIVTSGFRCVTHDKKNSFFILLTKATPHKARLTTLYVINLHLFRHITQKSLAIR